MIISILIAALSISQADMQSAQGAPSPELVARRMSVDLRQLAKIDNTQRETARLIGRDLTCLCGTCPKEPITDCRCGWASMNRDTIQHLVGRGVGRAEILAMYREVYGDQVLAMLPNDGFGRVAWALPYTAAVLGLVMVIVLAYYYRRRGGAADLPPGPEGRQDAQQDLARELNELD